MNKDTLGDRMKSNYEDRYRQSLPRRTNIVIRVDGKAFHTFTRNCNKPFDDNLMADMNKTAIALCEGIQGAKMAYVQSDEISVWLTDYDQLETNAWFDNNIQKMVSVSSSIATAAFNKAHAVGQSQRGDPAESYDRILDYTPAHFDARVFVIPEIAEVANYFLWRCQDAKRNSVQMIARSIFSHKECENKNVDQLKAMIDASGSEWTDTPPQYMYGRIAYKTVFDGFTTAPVTACTFQYWKEAIHSSSPKPIV